MGCSLVVGPDAGLYGHSAIFRLVCGLLIYALVVVCLSVVDLTVILSIYLV